MKYVCIGQPKTGTKTIAEIFRLLMFNVNNNPICSCSDANDFILLDNNIEYYINDNILKCRENIEMYEAFHDYPYSFNYAYINTNFPDSKFILTIRNCDEWFNSLFNYQFLPGATNKSLLKKLYGYETILLENKRDVISKYMEYNRNIINYFYNKPNKLLIINLAKQHENTIKRNLSIFLKKTIDFKIPHENKQIYNTEP